MSLPTCQRRRADEQAHLLRTIHGVGEESNDWLQIVLTVSPSSRKLIYAGTAEDIPGQPSQL